MMSGDTVALWSTLNDLADLVRGLHDDDGGRQVDALLDSGLAAHNLAVRIVDGRVSADDAVEQMTNIATAARTQTAAATAALHRADHLHGGVIADNCRALLAEINRTETRVRAAFPEAQALLC